MSTETANLGLTKPELDEQYQLSVWNGNSDIIDQFAGEVNAALAAGSAARETTDAALTGQINSGAKNRILDKQTTTTQTIKGVTVVHDAAAGTLTVSGTHDGTGDAKFELYTGSYSAQTTLPKGKYVFTVGQTGGSTVDGWAFVLTGLGVTCTGDPVSFTRSNDSGTIAPYLLIRGGTYDDLVFKPMLCTAADWALSQDYAPYCPTLQELYAMVQALQNGG